MVGLPTSVSSRSVSRLMPSRIASLGSSPFSAERTAVVISPDPPAFIIA